MINRILVVTIPHSGWHLLRRQLQKDDWEIKPCSAVSGDKPYNKIAYHSHPTTGEIPYIAPHMSLPHVAVIRHPYLVEESHKRRYDGYYDNNKQGVEFLVNQMEVFVSLEPEYCYPLDLPEHRDYFLNKINFELGITLKPIWHDVMGGQGDTHNMHWSDCEPTKEIIRFYEETRRFWDRYYAYA